MQSAGPLMVEHRLIERMVALLNKEMGRIRDQKKADSCFIDAAVDFFRIYADRTHHGKEEDILFKGLLKKKLEPEHKKIMEELIQEHVLARKNVGVLVESNEKYGKGDATCLEVLAGTLTTLTELYPSHIEKEDKHFFLPVMKYFDEKEQEAMLAEFWEFDKKMIHERYGRLVNEWEKRGV
ncbi:MAG: hemerythrin domain-containing protein [Candidatus Omnitrophota bacterium]